MGRKHNKKHKNKDEKCNVNEEFMEQLAEGIFTEMGKRRLIARKPDGEIAFELNLIASMVIGALLTIFLFPVIIGVLIWSFTQKVQFEIIREITDEEVQLLENVETHNTVMGVRYESGDGEATLLQA